MVERQEVEALLSDVYHSADRSGVVPGDMTFTIEIEGDTLAALCRAWLAVDEAPKGTVVESGWNDEGYYMDGRVYDLPTSLIGQRVRIVKEAGE